MTTLTIYFLYSSDASLHTSLSYSKQDFDGESVWGQTDARVCALRFWSAGGASCAWGERSVESGWLWTRGGGLPRQPLYSSTEDREVQHSDAWVKSVKPENHLKVFHVVARLMPCRTAFMNWLCFHDRRKAAVSVCWIYYSTYSMFSSKVCKTRPLGFSLRSWIRQCTNIACDVFNMKWHTWKMSGWDILLRIKMSDSVKVC